MLLSLQNLLTLKEDLTQKGEEGKIVANLLLLPLLGKPFSICDAWLNDIVIDNYFNWLASYYSTHKIETISSLELSTDFSHFRTKLERKQRLAEKRRLQEAEIILCPIAAAKHWYLLIIEKGQDGIFFVTTLDGFNQKQNHRVLWQKAESLIDFLHPETRHEGIIAKSSHIINPQQNVYDCGAVICYFAKIFCEKKSLYKEYLDSQAYTRFRQDIAFALASQEKEVFFNFGKKSQPAKTKSNPSTSLVPSVSQSPSF